MIESEDTPTMPRPVTDKKQTTSEATTIEVVAEPGPAPSPLHLPYMNSEDLLHLRIASDPQLSPDGKTIAFTVLRCNPKKDTSESAIYLVSTLEHKAKAPKQLTIGSSHDTMPRWSPDGQTLAFLSDRSGTTQIYFLSMHGGEAHQLSKLPQGITEYSWRPDGTMLLAHSPWRPEDEKTAPDETDTIAIYERLDAQWDGQGYNHGRHQQLWLIPLEGDAKRLTAEPVDLVQSCWSPDGTEIVFSANRRPDPDVSVSTALWVLTVATGTMRRLTPEEGLAQMPVWSPDGNSIAYIYSPDQTEASNYSPWMVAADGTTPPKEAVSGVGEFTCQAWIIDELRSEWLIPPQWYPDSKALLVSNQEHGQVHLYRLDIGQNQSTRLTQGNGRYISPHLSKDGKTITMVRADWFTPGDIWKADASGKDMQKLTGINDRILHHRQLIRPKRVSWNSADGLPLEGWLYLPPGEKQKRVPLILAVHGGPSLAWGDGYVHEFQVLAGRGYAVFAPNPRGSAGYGETFSRKVLNDWGGNDFHDLMSGIDHLLATEPIDEQRLGIGGISYGGYMTNWAITQTDRFKAAVSRNGISSLTNMVLLSDQNIWSALCMENEVLRRDRSPISIAQKITTPLLLLHADRDLRCPLSESWQLFVTLRKRKHMVKLVRYAHASHLMDWPQVGTPKQRLDRLQQTIAWFERFV